MSFALRQAHCLGSVVGTRTGKYGDPAIDLVDRDIDDLLVFIERQGRRLSSRTAGYNPVDAAGKKKTDVPLKTRDVQAHCRGSFKRGYDCRKDTFEHEQVMSVSWYLFFL